MFHANLKRLREAAGLTQVAFAKALSAPLRSVQNWEQGHRQPGLDMLPPMARVLGVRVDELLAPAEGPPKPRRRPKKDVSQSETPAKKGKRK